MPEDKLTLKEHALRAVASGSEAAKQTALLGSTVGLSNLALAPYLRNLRKDVSHVKPEFRTPTLKSLGDLAEKLLLAGGRDPAKGRPVELYSGPVEPGFASVVREWVSDKSQKAPRDVLRLGLNATPESIAHEVGHLTAGNKFEKALQTVSRYLVAKPALALPSVLAATALLNKPGDEPNPVATVAPYIGAAQLAGILGEEVRANRRAFKLLKDVGHKAPLKQQIGRHLMALPYLTRAAPLVAAPIGILAGIKAYDNARKQKRPMTFKGMLLAGGPTELAEKPSADELREKWAPYFS